MTEIDIPNTPLARHPKANIRQCMTELAGLFPSLHDATEQELRLWEAEFGGRPAELCIAAIRRAKLRSDKPFLPIATWEQNIVDLCREHSPRTASPVERTEAYLAETKQQGRTAEAERGYLTDWVKSLDNQTLEDLKRDAIAELAVRVSDRERWRSMDPRESRSLAGLMFAAHRRRETASLGAA
ncbi:MAG: hypothetical protein H7210_13190 [Pyrinomonadaceae bacterium]|nr:hypothetical protein [Phycisphaerales bacterium]